jgi:hypothetical protein
MLRKCWERGCSQHPTSGVFLLSSLMLRLYCDHVATRVACNIEHLEPLLSSTRHNSQHQMFATSKHNISNIEKLCLQHPTTHVCNIETQHLQHRKLMVATSNSRASGRSQSRQINCGRQMRHCGAKKK